MTNATAKLWITRPPTITGTTRPYKTLNVFWNSNISWDSRQNSENSTLITSRRSISKITYTPAGNPSKEINLDYPPFYSPVLMPEGDFKISFMGGPINQIDPWSFPITIRMYLKSEILLGNYFKEDYIAIESDFGKNFGIPGIASVIKPEASINNGWLVYINDNEEDLGPINYDVLSGTGIHYETIDATFPILNPEHTGGTYKSGTIVSYGENLISQDEIETIFIATPANSTYKRFRKEYIDNSSIDVDHVHFYKFTKQDSSNAEVGKTNPDGGIWKPGDPPFIETPTGETEIIDPETGVGEIPADEDWEVIVNPPEGFPAEDEEKIGGNVPPGTDIDFEFDYSDPEVSEIFKSSIEVTAHDINNNEIDDIIINVLEPSGLSFENKLLNLTQKTSVRFSVTAEGYPVKEYLIHVLANAVHIKVDVLMENVPAPTPEPDIQDDEDLLLIIDY